MTSFMKNTGLRRIFTCGELVCTSQSNNSSQTWPNETVGRGFPEHWLCFSHYPIPKQHQLVQTLYKRQQPPMPAPQSSVAVQPKASPVAPLQPPAGPVPPSPQTAAPPQPAATGPAAPDSDSDCDSEPTVTSLPSGSLLLFGTGRLTGPVLLSGAFKSS